MNTSGEHIEQPRPEAPARLRPAEAEQLIDLEKKVQRGIRGFIEAGEALFEIRDRRLYRAEHATFEIYLAERWRMARKQAYRVIAAYEVFRNLSPNGDILDIRESHLRPLTGLPPEQQAMIYSVIEQTAPDGAITGGHVTSVVNVLREILATGAVDDGSGQMIPVAAASVQHLKAMVIEETYERMLRQQQHITDRIGRKRETLSRFEWSNADGYAAMLKALPGALADLQTDRVEILIRKIIA